MYHRHELILTLFEIPGQIEFRSVVRAFRISDITADQRETVYAASGQHLNGALEYSQRKIFTVALGDSAKIAVMKHDDIQHGKNPEKVNAEGVNGIDYHYSKFNTHSKWVKEAQKLGMTVNAWTVNKENNMVQMFDLGVNFLTTDNPLEARALMEKMNIKELK